MAKYVEIGGLIKKGLSHSIVEKLSNNNGVIYKFGTISKMST